MEIKKAFTFNGRPFFYEGSLDDKLKVYPSGKEDEPTGTIVYIDNQITEFVKETINERQLIKMGACRDCPSKNSLGELLLIRKKTPQLLSYLLPLLEGADFLTHYTEGKTIWVRTK